VLLVATCIGFARFQAPRSRLSSAFLVGRTPYRPSRRPAACRRPAASTGGTGSVSRGVAPAPEEVLVLVCCGSDCRRDGSMETLRWLRQARPKGARVRSTGCLGPCGNGPCILAAPVLPGVCGKAVPAWEALKKPAGVRITGLAGPQAFELVAPWGFKEPGRSEPAAENAMVSPLRALGLDQLQRGAFWRLLAVAAFFIWAVYHDSSTVH